jgi:MoaA/NifB/PqqE/SkfB family radical SAM enzyme
MIASLRTRIARLFHDGTYHPLEGRIVRDYNKTRNRSVSTRVICHAPFKNMYCNITGNVGACWLRFAGPGCDPDSYPGASLRDIWFGERYERLREHLRHDDLEYKCTVCKDNLLHGNFVTVLARAYDNTYRCRRFPVMMELELDNICNLECVMCNGTLSSSIRKNREGKPKVPSAYGRGFVEEIEEFIPSLREVRFNGGEPFLAEINFEVWERMLAKNPRIRIVVATNGTVLNRRVRELLERGAFHINLSIDSIRRETYEAIRKNAVFDQTMEHVRYFDRYCRRKGTAFVLLLNPMRQNWHEIPEFVRFCNEMDVPVWFNTIYRPYEFALWNLERPQLREIYEELARHEAEFSMDQGKGRHSRHNRNIYKTLVEQVKAWCDEPLSERPDVREDILRYDERECRPQQLV